MKNPHAQALGSLGGKAGRGASKARTKEQASRAGKLGAKVRWAKGRTFTIASGTYNAETYQRIEPTA
jgi:hypothetical protein